METMETEKTRKFKSKVQIDFSSIDEAEELINETFAKVNTKEFGRKINLGQIFTYALKKLNDDDILKIQEENLTTEDLLRKKHKEYEKKVGGEIDFYEYIAKHLKPLKH